MITNQVTRAVFELLGDKIPGGYALSVKDQQIPLKLNKDGTTKYPEIRVAPFIERRDAYYEKHLDWQKRKYRHWQFGVFQVDIYSKNLIQAQNVYDILTKRLFDFFNLETVVFNYNNDFERIGKHTYRSVNYALLDDDFFKDIYGIRIYDTPLRRVRLLDDLKMNTFYVDDEYLYVKTNQEIQKMEIKVLMQGRLFSNGFSFSDNGLHGYYISKPRNLSSLEDNEVERISFDMEVLFSEKINREKIPSVKRITYPKLNVR